MKRTKDLFELIQEGIKFVRSRDHEDMYQALMKFHGQLPPYPIHLVFDRDKWLAIKKNAREKALAIQEAAIRFRREIDEQIAYNKATWNDHSWINKAARQNFYKKFNHRKFLKNKRGW